MAASPCDPRVVASGAYSIEPCRVPLGVERLGHLSPVVGPPHGRLGISLPPGGSCGMHRLPPLGYIPNEKLKNNNKQNSKSSVFSSIGPPEEKIVQTENHPWCQAWYIRKGLENVNSIMEDVHQ